MIELAAFPICKTRILLYYAMNAWFVVVFSILLKEVLFNTGILLARCANHSVSIDLSNENVASTVLSFYRYPMQLLRTSVP